jgi:hypothetical protein
VHQFLLHAQLGNFTREDVFTAFYGTRAAPPAVSQTFNAMEESAEERCLREFVHDSQAQLRMQVLIFFFCSAEERCLQEFVHDSQAQLRMQVLIFFFCVLVQYKSANTDATKAQLRMQKRASRLQAHVSIKALLRLCSGSVKALLRLC